MILNSACKNVEISEEFLRYLIDTYFYNYFGEAWSLQLFKEHIIEQSDD